MLLLLACTAPDMDDSTALDTAEDTGGALDDTATAAVPFIDCGHTTEATGLYDGAPGGVWAGFAPRYSLLNGAILGPSEDPHRYTVTTSVLYDDVWQDSATDLVQVEQGNGDLAVWIGATTAAAHIYGCEITLHPA
jgi:hypothetical protein